MVTKVLAYMEKYRMIEKDGTIIAGVSGGADSVCLLFVLLQIRKQIPFRVVVVHVNHGIRKEAEEDAAYVAELCRRESIPFYLIEENVKGYAEAHGISLEEAGRIVRYDAFQSILDREDMTGSGRIAVAHNSNDRAETMLFHLFRGTGLTGASGIHPVNREIIRPLLCVSRREIEEWLSCQGISYCVDITNEQDDYTRNKIRHHILPYAEEYISTEAIAHMSTAADHLLSAEEYIRSQVSTAMERCIEIIDPDEVKINIPEFEKENDYLKGWMVMSCLQKMQAARDVGAVHVENICRFLLKAGNGEIHLPEGIVVYKSYEKGMIVRKDKNTTVETEEKYPEYKVQGEGRWELKGIGAVEITVFPYEKTQNIPQKTYTKWLDYDKITKSIVFRTRKTGDYLTVNKALNRKSLQDYFVNEKIPREERGQLYVLAEDSHIIWIPGYRMSEYYKVSEETRNILQISISR